MWRIRRFEEAVDDLFARGLMHGTMHLSIGQEASATGACLALRPDDAITSTHRGHGHCIAKGADLTRMMAELLAKETGYCRGRGGSMHIADVATGNLGANGIVAGGIPIAAGAALAYQLRGADRVVACFFGDGAANEGAFHEARQPGRDLEAAGGLHLREQQVRHVDSRPRSRSRSTEHRRRAPPPTACPGVTVDGNDVEAVYEVVADGRRPGARRRGPDARRGRDLPLEGPQQVRQEPLPHPGGDRGVAGQATRSAASRRRARGGHCWTRARSHAVRDEVAQRDPRGRREAGNEAAADAAADDLLAAVYAPCRSQHDRMHHRRSRHRTADGLDRDDLRRGGPRGHRPGHGRADDGCSCSARTSASTAAPSASAATCYDRFGPDRVRDTPISELGIVGAGGRRGAGRHAADRRDPVLRLHQPGDGPDRQPGREDPLHARRRGQRADGAARPARLRHRRRGPALAEPGGVVRPRPRAQGRDAGHRRPTPRACCCRRSTTPTR